MFHFIAKCERQWWSATIVPAAAFVTTTSYLVAHTYAFDIVRGLFTAQSPSGKREEISSHLQDLITSVYHDIKDDFCKPYFKVFQDMPQPEVSIRWFPSSRMEPLTMGWTEMKTGVLIGLPNYYNIKEEHELPDSYTSIKKIRFFLPKDGKKEKPREEDCIDCEVKNSVPIDRHSELGREYLESLILSDEAKKYSIARELILGDTHRPIIICGVMMFSMVLPAYISKAIVTQLKLANNHVTHRLPYYTLSGLVGYLHYCFLSDAVNQYYYKKADNKARAINDSYRIGAIEYYTKMIQRHKALRLIDPELKNVYNEDGNYHEPYYRNKFIVLTDYLSKVTQSDNQGMEVERLNE